MPLDMRGNDDETEPERTGSRFSRLNKYRGETPPPKGDEPEIYVVDGEQLPPEIIEKSKKGMKLIDDLVAAFDKMQATDGREGTKEYAALLFEAAKDKALNLMVITAGITAISHLREAHGEH